MNILIVAIVVWLALWALNVWLAGSPVSRTRWGKALVPVIFGVTVLAQLVWVKPGPFTVDEVTYQRMTHELLHGGGFFIHNGYEDVPSKELSTLLVLPTAEGKLASQYPYGSPILGVPLYAAFGVRGPFFLNALALAISLLLCHRIAWQLLRDRTTALLSPVLLATTFFTEFGLGSWPHMTALACMLGAFSLGLGGHAAYDDNKRRALGLYAASGAVVGLGAALRLDAVLCAPAIVAPLLFASPTRVRGMIAFGIGMVPALGVIAVTNYIRWHAMSPMSYGPKGHSVSHHIPFAIALVLLTGLLWLGSRPQALPWARRHVREMLAGALVLVLAAVFVRPHLQRDVLEMFTSLHGIVSYVADLRIRPNAFPVLDQGVAIVYTGAFKKALLQSVPFFVLVLVPILRVLRRTPELRWRVAWLFVIPAGLAGFFGAFVWHGGMCINLRYLLGGLPFLAILSAFALRDVIETAPRGWWIAAALPIVPAAAFFVAFHDTTHFVPTAGQQTLVLTVPLLLGLVLVAGILRWHVSRTAVASLFILAVAGTSVGWTIGVSIEDAKWTNERRSGNFEVSECAAPRIAEHALVIADAPDAVYGIPATRADVRIATPIFDTFETTRQLIDWQLAHGYKAYAICGPMMWKLLRWWGVLDGLAVDPIMRIGHFVLGEIRVARPGEPSTGVIADIKGWSESCGSDHFMWSPQFDPRFGPSNLWTTRPAPRPVTQPR